MTNELRPGQSRVGYAWDAKIREPYPALLRDHDSRIELVVPYRSDEEIAARRYVGSGVKWGDDPEMTRYDYELPSQFWFYDSHGFVTLVGVRRSSGRMFGGPSVLSEAVLAVRYAVFTGNPGIGFERVNGLRAHLEGLDQWLGIRSVTNSLDDPSTRNSGEVSVTIKKPTKERVARRLNLTLIAGAKWNLPGGVGRTVIEDSGITRTKVEKARPWQDHLGSHRDIHALLEVAAWRSVGFHDISAMHLSDPLRVLSGDVVGEHWADVSTYEFPAPSADGKQLWFLFTYQDIGAAGVRRWLRLRTDFRKGINAMTFGIRHAGSSLDGLVSDSGIGLEEIGHRIQLELGSGASRQHHKKLEVIAEEVGDLLPFDGAEWATFSTGVYNDVKHADRPEAEVDAMRKSLKQNRIVFRIWLARRLGVKKDVIRKGQWLLDRS